MRRGPIASLCVALLAVGACSGSATPEVVERVNDDTVVTVSEGLPIEDVRVFRSTPADGAIDGVWIVIAGTNRDADVYRDYWADAAESDRALILAPEFEAADLPGSTSYNLANMVDSNGAPNPPEAWLYNAIEDIFTDATEAFDLTDQTYRLFGHSAGAQFVTRMVTFERATRICHAYAANAGWYTATTETVAFPYGLAGSPGPDVDLPEAFGTKMSLLLGSKDTDPHDSNLRRDDGADRQGTNRLDRGNYYYDLAGETASDLGARFEWTRSIVEDVAHDGEAMSRAALELSADDPACP